MKNIKKVVLKTILPLVITLSVVCVFFVSYNRYLLDRVLGKLKVSLKELEDIQNPEIGKIVKSILEDTFIMEITRKDLDLATIAKIEFSNQIVTNMTDKIQFEDALYFIRDIIREKEKVRPSAANIMEGVLANLNLVEKRESVKGARMKIKEIRNEIISGQYSTDVINEKYLDIARLYISFREWDQASVWLDKIIKQGPDSDIAAKAYFYLGLVHKFKGNYEEAKNIFGKIKDKLIGDLGALSYFEEGDSLLHMGRPNEAVAIFKDIFEKNPSSEISQIAQFRAGYIEIYGLKNIKGFDEAFNKMSSGRAGRGSEFELADVIKIYDLREKNIYESFRKISDQFPQNKLIPEIARVYRRKGFKLAKEGYSFLQKGRLTLAASRFILSEEHFNLALKIAPRDALAHSGKALTNYFLDNKEQALVQAKLAKKLSPEDPIVLANLGFIYAGVRMVNAAIDEYKKVLKVFPESALINYNVGTFYILKGEYSKAKKYFRAAKKINPDLPDVHNNLGYIFWKEKQYKEARLEFEKGISLQDDFVAGHYNLGMAYYNLEKYAEAKQQFNKVNKLQPKYRKSKWFLDKIKKKK